MAWVLNNDTIECRAQPEQGRRAYVASRWCEPMHAHIVELLRAGGWWVYDYRQRAAVAELDLVGAAVPLDQLRALLTDEVRCAHARNLRAIAAADILVVILPGGVSVAHEVGYAQGCGVPVVAVATAPLRPDIAYADLTLVERPRELLHTVDRERRRAEDEDPVPARPSEPLVWLPPTSRWAA